MGDILIKKQNVNSISLNNVKKWSYTDHVLEEGEGRIQVFLILER